MNSRQSIMLLVEFLGPRTTLLLHGICINISSNNTMHAFSKLILAQQIPTDTIAVTLAKSMMGYRLLSLSLGRHGTA